MLMYALQEDFFIILHSMLESQTQVSEIHCVKSAKVPLMRFKFNGISIDFPYARIPAISVTEVCILYYCSRSIIAHFGLHGLFSS